jgi:hypothetical protein
MERTAPQGPGGDQDERGEAGLSRAVRRAVVFLFVLSVLLGATSLLFTSYEVRASDHKFCAVIQGFTIVPVPEPADPRANPSRETDYLWYVKFIDLGRNLGCG